MRGLCSCIRLRCRPGTSTGEGRSMVFAPGRDAADDEEPLAGLDEPEPARFADQLVARADGREPVLELLLLRAQLRDLRLPALENGARVLVGAERFPVEERDHTETGEGEESRPPQ